MEVTPSAGDSTLSQALMGEYVMLAGICSVRVWTNEPHWEQSGASIKAKQRGQNPSPVSHIWPFFEEKGEKVILPFFPQEKNIVLHIL